MDLSSSNLFEEFQKLVKKTEISVNNIVFQANTDHVPGNYVGRMYDNLNDITNDYAG